MAESEWSCPDWIAKALQSLQPPERMLVHEWADAKRILDSKSSSMPGRWRTDVTPYLAGIMETFKDPEIEMVSFVKPTQLGVTEILVEGVYRYGGK